MSRRDAKHKGGTKVRASTRGPSGLALLEQATRMLAEAETFDDIKAIRDKAEAARTYARAVNAGLYLQNQAAEIKLRAERKAGTFLRGLPLRGGDRRSKAHDDPLKLADLGISQNQSKRWQKEAEVPEAVFRQFLVEAKQKGLEITAAGLIRLAGRSKNGHPQGKKDTVNGAAVTTADGVIDLNGDGLRINPESCLAELVKELRNQYQSLSQVLSVLVGESGETKPLEENDCRLLRYLLGQIDGTVGALERVAS